jgi:hypothetical protein
MTIHHRVRHAFTLLSILYMIADLDLLGGISVRIRIEAAPEATKVGAFFTHSSSYPAARKKLGGAITLFSRRGTWGNGR